MKTTIAKILKWLGFKPYYSTGIDGELSSGYGKLDNLGYFEYPIWR